MALSKSFKPNSNGTAAYANGTVQASSPIPQLTDANEVHVKFNDGVIHKATLWGEAQVGSTVSVGVTKVNGYPRFTAYVPQGQSFKAESLDQIEAPGFMYSHPDGKDPRISAQGTVVGLTKSRNSKTPLATVKVGSILVQGVHSGLTLGQKASVVCYRLNEKGYAQFSVFAHEDLVSTSELDDLLSSAGPQTLIETIPQNIMAMSNGKREKKEAMLLAIEQVATPVSKTNGTLIYKQLVELSDAGVMPQ